MSQQIPAENGRFKIEGRSEQIQKSNSDSSPIRIFQRELNPNQQNKNKKQEDQIPQSNSKEYKQFKINLESLQRENLPTFFQKDQFQRSYQKNESHLPSYQQKNENPSSYLQKYQSYYTSPLPYRFQSQSKPIDKHQQTNQNPKSFMNTQRQTKPSTQRERQITDTKTYDSPERKTYYSTSYQQTQNITQRYRPISSLTSPYSYIDTNVSNKLHVQNIRDENTGNLYKRLERTAKNNLTALESQSSHYETPAYMRTYNTNNRPLTAQKYEAKTILKQISRPLTSLYKQNWTYSVNPNISDQFKPIVIGNNPAAIDKNQGIQGDNQVTIEKNSAIVKNNSIINELSEIKRPYFERKYGERRVLKKLGADQDPIVIMKTDWCSFILLLLVLLALLGLGVYQLREGIKEKDTLRKQQIEYNNTLDNRIQPVLIDRENKTVIESNASMSQNPQVIPVPTENISVNRTVIEMNKNNQTIEGVYVKPVQEIEKQPQGINEIEKQPQSITQIEPQGVTQIEPQGVAQLPQLQPQQVAQLLPSQVPSQIQPQQTSQIQLQDIALGEIGQFQPSAIDVSQTTLNEPQQVEIMNVQYIQSEPLIQPVEQSSQFPIQQNEITPITTVETPINNVETEQLVTPITPVETEEQITPIGTTEEMQPTTFQPVSINSQTNIEKQSIQTQKQTQTLYNLQPVTVIQQIQPYQEETLTQDTYLQNIQPYQEPSLQIEKPYQEPLQPEPSYQIAEPAQQIAKPVQQIISPNEFSPQIVQNYYEEPIQSEPSFQVVNSYEEPIIQTVPSQIIISPQISRGIQQASTGVTFPEVDNRGQYVEQRGQQIYLIGQNPVQYLQQPHQVPVPSIQQGVPSKIEQGYPVQGEQYFALNDNIQQASIEFREDDERGPLPVSVDNINNVEIYVQQPNDQKQQSQLQQSQLSQPQYSQQQYQPEYVQQLLQPEYFQPQQVQPQYIQPQYIQPQYVQLQGEVQKPQLAYTAVQKIQQLTPRIDSQQSTTQQPTQQFNAQPKIQAKQQPVYQYQPETLITQPTKALQQTTIPSTFPSLQPQPVQTPSSTPIQPQATQQPITTITNPQPIQQPIQKIIQTKQPINYFIYPFNNVIAKNTKNTQTIIETIPDQTPSIIQKGSDWQQLQQNTNNFYTHPTITQSLTHPTLQPIKHLRTSSQ